MRLIDADNLRARDGWMLVSTTRRCVYCGLLGGCDFDNCGKTWMAYRRKPVEGAT